jgi:AbiU2
VTSAEALFESELEIFRTETEGGIQFFSAYLAVHAIAAKHKAVHRLLNEAPLFWNTCLTGLQTASFMALGRIFDNESDHNLSKLLRITQDNREIFSKAALGRRKQGNSPEPPEWLTEYLRNSYEPTILDFRRIRSHVRKRRKIYETNYRDIRHKWFAHKVVSEQIEIRALFGKANTRELQQLFAFLSWLYESLWELFFNGRKVALRPLRYSVKRILGLALTKRQPQGVHEKITHEAEQFLRAASAVVRKDAW